MEKPAFWIGLGFCLRSQSGCWGVIHGIQEAIGTRAAAAGVPAFMDIFMSTVILLAGLGDLRMLVRGISGRRRIARHHWRMCFGWFIATGSFFLGQHRYFPPRGVGPLCF